MRSLLIVLLAVSPTIASAADIVGRASVIDGDTLEIASTRIRLSGIDAPESSKLCRGKDSLHYRCGAKAANELDVMLKDRPVTCTPVARSYERVVAICTVGDTDIGAWMVERGLALDWPKYSKEKYAADQQVAEREGRGIWSGSFTVPWQYRACIKASGRIEACSDDAKLNTWGRWRGEQQ